ncbi:hypothetical protein [Tateyamaria pelophila]|uniref:hypothetical protein n=1 Tax=Tateyamaria pelophila TaxID=328415 RepID=UPI001CBD98D4|nr:hypothetical protein [Tateyamaria pelophila]
MSPIPATLDDADPVVGADGANSTLCRAHDDTLGTHGSQLSNAFAWYGAERLHHRPTLSFRSEGGAVPSAHYYPYADNMCTNVTECDHAAW